MADAIAAVARVRAVPTMLKAITDLTGLRLSLVAEVTPEKWMCCAVNDQLGFGLVPGGELDVRTTLCSEVREARKSILISHASKDPVYCGHPTPKLYAFESYISVPIYLRDSRYFGNLCALDSNPIPLDGRTQQMFETFAALLGLQIELESDLDQTDVALTSERKTAVLREQFIAVLGHDLRTPLGAIGNGAEILRSRLDKLDDPLVTRAIAGIERSATRMKGLVDDLLDLARGRSGGGVPITASQVSNLNAVIEHTVDEYRDARSSFRLELQPLPAIQCDESRIAQAISNLVGNAVQYRATDTPIDVRSRAATDVVIVEVTNRGVTIPPERVASMFEPYQRGSSSANASGLGLGLYIVGEIARAHSGNVACSSADGVTTFTLTLPRA